MIKKNGDDKRPRSLKQRLILFMVFCWVIPMLCVLVFMAFSYRKDIIERSEELVKKELQTITEHVAIRIEDSIMLTETPTYAGNWEEKWEAYKNDKISRSDFYQQMSVSLRQKFFVDERFQTIVFYLWEEGVPIYYSSKTGYSYNDYFENIHEEITPIMYKASSYMYLKVIDGKIFLIRNTYTTTDYQKYGTIVVELDKKSILKDINLFDKDNLLLCLGSSDEPIQIQYKDNGEKQKIITDRLLAKYDGKSSRVMHKEVEGTYLGFMVQSKHDDFHIGVIATMNHAELYTGLYEMYKIFFIVMVCFIPMLFYVFWFFREQISVPVTRLVKASRIIEKGAIGTIVSGATMPNAEFDYLMESFNHMSEQVKYLFDCAYDEIMARKDAQIAALQAQINPHFLNNTLETMNWQARMAGDTTVSKMIEALGTVLDYLMDRSERRIIRLSEELRCADAYIYIMSMRFGKRLSVSKEIDEGLLQFEVPQLILQPIIENAVLHGIKGTKTNELRIKIFHDEEKIYLQVLNNGAPLTKDEIQKIEAILKGDKSNLPEDTGKHTSIGIRNVNMRIKLVYGEAYGLKIESDETGHTVSTIEIPYEKRGEDRVSIQKKTVLEELNRTKNGENKK